MNETNQEKILLNMDVELISITDLDGVITYANANLCNCVGQSESALIGTKAKHLNHPDMPKAARFNLKNKLKNKKPWRGAVKKNDDRNGFFWVKEVITPIYENSSVVAYQSVCKPLESDKKQKAIKIYDEINDSKSIFYMWENFYYRVGLYSILTFFIFLISQLSSWVSVFYALIPVVIYYCEINKSSTFFESLTGSFDDVSRYIFSKEALTKNNKMDIEGDSIKKCEKLPDSKYWFGMNFR